MAYLDYVYESKTDATKDLRFAVRYKLDSKNGKRINEAQANELKEAEQRLSRLTSEMVVDLVVDITNSGMPFRQ